MTRRTFVPFAAALPFAAFGAETPKERGKRLVEQAIRGLGGDAFRKMRTRTEAGLASSFYREQLTGYSAAHIYTKYLEPGAAQKPGMGLLELQRQALGKKQDDIVLFTGSEGYEVTFRGAKPLPDDQVKQHRESTLQDIFYILRERLSEPGMEFEGAGPDVVENQPVEILDIYDAENRNLRVWLNADSFLPVRQRYYRWDPTIKDRREEVTRYTKYRETGGVMWPFAIARERDTERIYERSSEHVAINDPLKDSLFELPNGIRILTK